MTTKEEKEPFVARWSRLKQETKEPPQKAPEKLADPKAPPPQVPPLDKLTFDSDYRAFFHPKVDEDVRRAALKKLFSDPRFNVMDGLDVYIDDYSKTEPIPAAMLAQLRQAQNILEWAKGDEKQKPEGAAPDAVAAAQPAALEQQSSPVMPPVSSGEPATANHPVAADETSKNQVLENRSS